MSGSKSTQKQSSKSFQFDFSDLEELLQGLNLDIVNQQLDALFNQADFQDQVFGLLNPVFQGLGEQQQLQTDLFTPEEQRQQLLDQQGRIDSFNSAQDELLGMQLDALRQGPGATDEQRELINAATEAQIARGTSDIEEFGRRQMDVITGELAPSRGLRPSDSPIQDRAFSLGGELSRQQGNLVSDLRGQQAQAELNFPLTANASQGALSQFQQQLAASAGNFQSQLQQQAFANRLNLFGQAGQLGLGLVGASSPQAQLQETFRPQLGTKTKGSATTKSGGISSRSLKHNKREIDEADMLDALMTLPVERWQYIGVEYGQKGDHIGPYAEDFQQAFGVGDGMTINYMDAIGVLMATVKALTDRVKELEE